MTYYRKKPVVIEAMQWSGDNLDAIKAFAGPSLTWVPGNSTAIGIGTLEGLMTCTVGDWIIKGVQGEFYPCKPDIFAATYEPTERAQ